MPAKCKQRERILASGVVDVPTLPLGAVRGALCFRCFEPADKILKCAGCRRAGYCSQACQKLDWIAVHKKQCKVLKIINEEDLKDYSDRRTWADYRRVLIRYGHMIQAMTEVRDTVFVVQAQPYCSGCYRSANQLSHREITLNVCRDCRLLHHCSDCPDSHPKAMCKAYQDQNKIEHFRHGLFENTGKASVIACTEVPRSNYKSFARSEGWYDYYVNISDKAFIKGNTTPDFTSITSTVAKGGPDNKEFEEGRCMFLLFGTDTMTMPLTVIAALEDLQILDLPTIKIHLLGATGREFLAMSCFEEILHVVPSIQCLDIAAVGPSSLLAGQGPSGYAPKYPLPCCPSCQSAGKSRPISAFQGLYHDFAKSPYYEKPDLIVAFNSGFVDGDDANTDWDKSIRLVVESGVPALFTTYNPREAWGEQSKMRRLGARFVVEPGENKWRSLVPMPEFLDKEYEMWHQNYWRYIIKGKQP
ncbi:hypothetical protein BDU57DRAFT_511119 [Ampelomyces quisqualis]|uniref:MYND-type domain-containing protein n=1 Tax=Ampelomyces quisqualis TaxID=50730 RepID=A0A6A5R5J3_AMPQU|nr:hypothetical protein BDU57DRAFT_511119 [Ampelomyces quisqualis]